MKLKTISLFVFVLFVFSNCGQLKEMKAFSKCQFRYQKITNIELSNVDIQQKTSIEELGFLSIAKFIQGLSNGNVPLSLTYNIEIKNPNNHLASINNLEWIAFIDGKKLVEGVIKERFEIPAKQTAIMPLNIKVNLLDVLSKDIGKSALNYAFNLVDKNNQPTRLTLKVKPSIMLGKTLLKYPSYLKIEKEFN